MQTSGYLPTPSARRPKLPQLPSKQEDVLSLKWQVEANLKWQVEALSGLDNFTKCILALAETEQSGAMQSISSVAECISCQSDGLHFSNARNALWKTAAAHQASPPSCIINSIVMMVNITITIIITINNHHQTHLLQMHIGNRDILIASSPPSSSKLMVTFLTILLQSPSMLSVF